MAGPSVLTFALALAIAAAQAPQEDTQKFFTYIGECHSQFPTVNNETIQYAVIHDMAVPDESSEDARCFVACVMEKMGLLQADGSFDEDAALRSLDGFREHLRRKGHTLDTPRARRLLQRCADRVGSGACVQSYSTVKCTLAGLSEIARKA